MNEHDEKLEEKTSLPKEKNTCPQKPYIFLSFFKFLLKSRFFSDFFCLNLWLRKLFLFKNKSGITTIESQFKAYQKVEKLYTVFSYVPFLDFKKGLPLTAQGTQAATKAYNKVAGLISKKAVINESEAKEEIIGFCARKYEVGFGFKNINDIFQDNKSFNSSSNF